MHCSVGRSVVLPQWLLRESCRSRGSKGLSPPTHGGPHRDPVPSLHPHHHHHPSPNPNLCQPTTLIHYYIMAPPDVVFAEPQRFDLTESADEAMQYLNEHGYVVLANVLDAAQVLRARELLWDWLENESGQPISRTDPSTWHSWPKWRDTGVIPMYVDLSHLIDRSMPRTHAWSRTSDASLFSCLVTVSDTRNSCGSCARCLPCGRPSSACGTPTT